nr:reverse transcriptase domain-containing protein [Tanacetum cinerariifolium]
GEIKKLEVELWNLKVKGTDVTSYTLRFKNLALICGRMFHEESDELEKYVGGLPDQKASSCRSPNEVVQVFRFISKLIFRKEIKMDL